MAWATSWCRQGEFADRTCEGDASNLTVLGMVVSIFSKPEVPI